MHNLEHLFLVGEFPERGFLLSGLTLEQVTLCPDGASHRHLQERCLRKNGRMALSTTEGSRELCRVEKAGMKNFAGRVTLTFDGFTKIEAAGLRRNDARDGAGYLIEIERFADDAGDQI